MTIDVRTKGDGTWLRYGLVNEGSRRVLTPNVRTSASEDGGYLELLEAGGPITPTPWYSQFYFGLPQLDLKIVNNTDKALLFTAATLEVSRSRLDPRPVLLVGRVNEHGKLYFWNIGWGRVYDATVQLQVAAEGKTLDGNTARTIDLGTFDTSTVIDLTELFRGLGVDLPLLRRRMRLLWERPDVGDYDHARDALVDELAGPFKDGGGITGEISYVAETLDEKKRRQSVRFETSIYFRIPPPTGPLEPSFDYSVLLDVDRRGYRVNLPLSQVIKPGEADRFTITIASRKSSIHEFRLSLLYNEQESITLGPFELRFFMSRADTDNLQGFLEDGADAVPEVAAARGM